MIWILEVRSSRLEVRRRIKPDACKWRVCSGMQTGRGKVKGRTLTIAGCPAGSCLLFDLKIFDLVPEGFN